MKKSAGVLRDLHDDESGAVLIWVSLMIVVIMGMVALAIDGGRYLNLDSNMQQIADSAALAGAKRLDGSDQAIENARNDALNFLSKNMPDNWSDRDRSNLSQIATVNFYENVADAPAGKLSDTDDKRASVIEVVTISRGLSTSFTKVVGAGDSAYTDAKAMARVGYSVCKPMQSFLCNPFESSEAATDKGLAKNFSEPNVKRGDMFLLGAGSGGSSGSWGFIDPNDRGGTTAKEWQQFWSAVSPTECKSISVGLNGPYPDTGADTGMKAAPGINTRFDNPGRDLTNIRAPVVTDGWIITPSASSGSCGSTKTATNLFQIKTKVGSVKTVNDCSFSQADQLAGTAGAATFTGYRDYCNTRDAGTPPGWGSGSPNPAVPGCLSAPTASSTGIRVGSCPLPRDRDLGGTGRSWYSVRQGTGPKTEDLRAYWSNHHTAAYPTGATTRYELYLKEVENLGRPGYFDATGITSPPVDSTEPPADACNDSSVGDASRRLINVAIVDCGHWSLSGASTRLPMFTKYAQFFLTEPATDNYTGATGAGDQGKMYVEFVKSYDVNEEGGAIFQQIDLVK